MVVAEYVGYTIVEAGAGRSTWYPATVEGVALKYATSKPAA